jgi:hypothetical protein
MRQYKQACSLPLRVRGERRSSCGRPVQEGQLYNAEDGRKALRDVFALGLFDNVQVFPKPNQRDEAKARPPSRAQGAALDASMHMRALAVGAEMQGAACSRHAVRMHRITAADGELRVLRCCSADDLRTRLGIRRVRAA